MKNKNTIIIHPRVFKVTVNNKENNRALVWQLSSL